MLNHLFNDWLLANGMAQEQIIKVNLDSYENRKLRNPDELYSYVKARAEGLYEKVVLLDEIQMVEHFEEVLNGFLSWGNTDVYVTGSNAKLLSKDIITEFRGRGQEIRMYPLSFAEYMSAFDGSRQQGFNQFMMFGSLPQILSLPGEGVKMEFLQRLMAETYMRDLTERHDIKDDADLEELVTVMASSVGALTNPTNLSNAFKSVKHSSLSYATIKRYLDYMEDCFMIERSKRYDIKGKKYIDTPYKYYFTDLGLRNARLGFSQIDPGHLMENMIYNELRIRGYSVDVGSVAVQKRNADGVKVRARLEVDFVCGIGSKRYYIQSAYKMVDQEKVKQEVASLSEIDDFFKKIVVVGDETPIIRTEKGIVIMGIYDFLLDERSLEL